MILKIKKLFNYISKFIEDKVLLFYYKMLSGDIKSREENDRISFYLGKVYVNMMDNIDEKTEEVFKSCVYGIYKFMIKNGGQLYDVRLICVIYDEDENGYVVTLINDEHVYDLRSLIKCVDNIIIKFKAKYGHYKIVSISRIELKCKKVR